MAVSDGQLPFGQIADGAAAVRAAVAAALVEGDNVSIDVDPDTGAITISSIAGGGPSTTRWEVVVTGIPAEAVTTVDGSDWLYVEVPI